MSDELPFSKSTVSKICRQKICRCRVNGRAIRHSFYRSQNVPASCERSLSCRFNDVIDKPFFTFLKILGISSFKKIIVANQWEQIKKSNEFSDLS